MPSSAATKPIPTHQIIQTKVGAKFASGFSLPNSAVASVSSSIATAAARMGSSSARLPSARPSAGTASKFRRG